MDMKSIGFMFVLYLTRIDISYTDRIISVKEYTCGGTFYLGSDEKILLSYSNKGFRQQYNEFSSESCGVTFVKRNTAQSICIKNTGSYLDPLALCDASFNYYIGNVTNAPMQNGYKCSDFRSRPMCTDKSKVHAAFRNAYSFGYKVDLELYTKEQVVTTTITPTTQSNVDGDDSTRTVAILGATVAGMFLLVIFFYSIRLYMRHESKMLQERARTNETEQCSPSAPPQADDQLLDQQTYTDEAPPYSVVMQQQKLYSVEEDKHLHLHDPVYQEATSTAAIPLPIPENRPSYHDQPGTNHTVDEQAGNHITPTAPPLDYLDDLPPPYPGD